MATRPRRTSPGCDQTDGGQSLPDDQQAHAAQEFARADLARLCERLDLAAKEKRWEFHARRQTNPEGRADILISAGPLARHVYGCLARDIEPVLVRIGIAYDLDLGITADDRLLNWTFARMGADPVDGGSEGEEHEENAFRLASLALRPILAKLTEQAQLKPEPDGPGIYPLFYWKGDPFRLSDRQWKLASRLWGRDAVSFAELAKAWDDDAIHAGTVYSEIVRLAKRLVEHGVPAKWTARGKVIRPCPRDA
ncbi:MAG: hypothetical protein ACYC35_25495 [Pirellulales bacterium]